jgi:small subunit ribosomal protein S19e
MDMTVAYDVPPDILIERLTNYIKENVSEVNPPEWASFVKTGSHTEQAPQNPDWWYVRASSLLRKLYLKGPLGISRLRKVYGGRKRRGVKPAHFQRAGGNIIRTILQQLQEANLVEIDGIRGRVISSKGRSLLDAMSNQIKKELDRTSPELRLY